MEEESQKKNHGLLSEQAQRSKDKDQKGHSYGGAKDRARGAHKHQIPADGAGFPPATGGAGGSSRATGRRCYPDSGTRACNQRDDGNCKYQQTSLFSRRRLSVVTYSFSLSLQRTTKPPPTQRQIPPKKQQTPEQKAEERRLFGELSSASSAEEEGGGGSSSATSAASSDEAASEDEAPGKKSPKKKKVASSTGPTPSKKVKKQAPPHAAESQPVPPTVPDKTGDVLKEYFFPHFLALRTACLALQPRFNPQAWQQTKSVMNHFCAVLGDYGLTTRKDHRLK